MTIRTEKLYIRNKKYVSYSLTFDIYKEKESLSLICPEYEKLNGYLPFKLINGYYEVNDTKKNNQMKKATISNLMKEVERLLLKKEYNDIKFDMIQFR